MTDGLTTTVEGADNLRRTLAQAADGLDEMQGAGTKAGNLVRTRAAGLAPVETGALSRSIRAEATGNTVEISAGEPYAGFQEYGTVTVPASPYMRPALEAATGQIVDIYGDEVQHLLEGVKGA